MSEQSEENKQLKEVLAFILATANAVGKSLEDGNVSVFDVMHFIDPAMLAVDAFRDIQKALDEFDSLTDQGKEDIYDYIDENFDIDIDCVEPLVQKCLKAAVALGDVICDFMDQYQDEE